ncbi:MAG: FAD-dependent oxidoreductase [Bdellovibrionaceae bacterium]|nr:FAD-dependent oxidoreductase [Pseudobdellovibrionaceae bacterium]
MGDSKVDVLVVGGGIIGLTLAHELQKSGRQVLLIEKGEVGFGCSYGNAGWITPCFAMPLPQPGMFLKSIGWLLNPESPLYIKPQPSWLLARWMMSFLAAMNEKRLRESVAVLTDISKYSLTFYRELAGRAPQTFGFDQKGLLMVSATPQGLAAAEGEMRLMLERGIPGKLLSGEEIRQLEPSLKPLIRGGVYFPSEAHSEPLATVQAVAREFQELGGRVQPRTEVYDFEFADGKISRVLTTRGNFAPDLVVLATGTWSRRMARDLRVSVPILGGKGYSLIVDDFETKPAHPIMIVERKIAVTPRADSVRLAGTLELVDQDDGITRRRVNAILQGSEAYLHLRPQPQVKELWRGLRPCTPDGVPMLGFSKRHRNLFYSVGHQMLGLQSAPGSARLSADLILGRSPLTDPRPFRPERFE